MRLRRALSTLLLFTAGACSGKVASRAELDRFRNAAGALVVTETTATSPRGRYTLATITLKSTSGLIATGQVLAPTLPTHRQPAVLLQDGREENSQVIGRLPAEFGDIVVLALDYPAEIPYEIQLRDVALSGRALSRAAHRIPSLFILGRYYLIGRNDVDPHRVAIAATSFAVPFATIAAAADPWFQNVALIYGAGDLPAVLAANLDLEPKWLRGPAAWLATRPFADLEPERFAGAIAPRPIVMVNGVDDPQMPVAAVQKLYDAARAPKHLMWLHTGHLEPTDSTLIRQLVDTALARLPVLH